MSDDNEDDAALDDARAPNLQYPEQRLRRADRLMGAGAEGRREAMLIFRELADLLIPEEPRDAARLARIAATPSTVDPHFEHLFGRLAAVSPDPAQRAAAFLAAGRIAAQRGDFHRAEAGFRRALRQDGDAADRIAALHLLTIAWLTQGREHEGLAAASAALEIRCPDAAARPFCRSHLVGARIAAEDWSGVLREVAEWETECEKLGVHAAAHTVAFHAAHACVRLGDADGAKAWLGRVRTEDAEPAHAEVLRPVVTLRTAQIAAASGAAVRAADLAASVARSPRNDLRTRADAIALAVEFLCASGAALRAAGFAEEWAKIVATERDRLGTGIAIRHSVTIIAALAAAQRTDPHVVGVPLLRRIAASAADAVADRVEELVRSGTDRDVPPLPAGDETLTRFRRARVARVAVLGAPPVAEATNASPALVRIAAVVGDAPVVCPVCVCVDRPGADGLPRCLPLGHLIAHLPGTRIADAPCSDCAAAANGGRPQQHP